MFVVPLIDPRVVERTTVYPEPVVTLFPLPSLSCTAIADVLLPLAVIDVGFAVIVDVAVEAAPGFITIDADVPTWALTDVAVNVPEPDVPV